MAEKPDAKFSIQQVQFESHQGPLPAPTTLKRLAGLFIYGRQAQKKERAEKAKIGA